MKLSPQQLASHLSRGVAPMYVVAGDEPLLVQEVLDAIRARARKDGYSEREVFDVDRGFEWGNLVDTLATGSLFAARRIVELRLSGAPGEEGGRIVRQFAERPAPGVLLLLAAGALDGRARNSAWYRTCEASGVAVYCWPVRAEELPSWLEARLRGAGVHADSDAVRELAERTEGNLLAAAQNVEKLKLLFPGQTVGIAQVEAAVADSARFGAFDVFDKILAGSAPGAVRGLQRLREEGAALPEVLGAFAFSLRQWVRAAENRAAGQDARAAAADAGVRGPRQARMAAAVSRTHAPQLHGWLYRLLGIDVKSKSSDAEQGWNELLTWAVRASGAPRKGV
jgi:DNA polymerase III subunit delta